ncbi:response regulator [Poriferisphaera sp. WC338]|uniref:response regulator n=1 Tax=Poriferisphaera sp. WC338 TaxID=3425129 RepID=UPI003D817500
MKPKRILIADDDATLVRILEMRLRHMGFNTQASHDAMHALTLVHRDPPDLVLLDINMPAGDGLAACEMLANDRRLQHIPVVVVTGRSDQKTVDRCHELGVPLVVKNGDVWSNLKHVVGEVFSMAGVA